MMRKLAVALVAGMFLFAGTASANYTIDLIWSDTGTATLTVTPGDTAVPATGSPCGSGFLYGGSGTARCLVVVFTATDGWKGVSTTVGWDAAASGIALDYVGLRAFGLYGGSGGPAGSAPAGTIGSTALTDCLPNCDTAYGSFAALSFSALAAGTYTIGSISFDASGAAAGVQNILNFLRGGIDGVTNAKGNAAAVQVNGAILNVIPEPGTASLLGLGIMGLVLAGRRRKA
jgi:hypothetical protein